MTLTQSVIDFPLTCKKCGELKPPSEFPRESRNTNGVSGKCQKCHNKNIKKWRNNNADRAREIGRGSRKTQYYKDPKKALRSARNSKIKIKYGLTEAAFDAMLEAQHYKCAICATQIYGYPSKNTHIDHDHDSGAVRALLCGVCNPGLGIFKDDIRLLEAAIVYLRKHGKS